MIVKCEPRIENHESRLHAYRYWVPKMANLGKAASILVTKSSTRWLRHSLDRGEGEYYSERGYFWSGPRRNMLPNKKWRYEEELSCQSWQGIASGLLFYPPNIRKCAHHIYFNLSEEGRSSVLKYKWPNESGIMIPVVLKTYHLYLVLSSYMTLMQVNLFINKCQIYKWGF